MNWNEALHRLIIILRRDFWLIGWGKEDWNDLGLMWFVGKRRRMVCSGRKCLTYRYHRCSWLILMSDFNIWGICVNCILWFLNCPLQNFINDFVGVFGRYLSLSRTDNQRKVVWCFAWGNESGIDKLHAYCTICIVSCAESLYSLAEGFCWWWRRQIETPESTLIGRRIEYQIWRTAI